MAAKLVLTDRSVPGVTILTLNRPEKRNALNASLLRELIEAIRETHKIQDQRVIILRGEGKVYCAGLDLKESIENNVGEQTIANLQEALRLLYESPLVTIAEIHGAAIAGGAGLAAATDIVVASEESVIAYPEVRRGIVAALVSTLLVRQISERHIRELLLLGEPINAHRAYHMGLVNLVVPLEELHERALLIAEKAKKGSPAAIVETKRLLEILAYVPLEDDIEKAAVVHRQSRMHIEAQEGIAAFLENREPRWGY